MFDGELFKRVIAEHGKTMDEIAGIIGCNTATVYRKISGVSDFTRNEIQLFKNGLGLDSSAINQIFFAEKIA